MDEKTDMCIVLDEEASLVSGENSSSMKNALLEKLEDLLIQSIVESFEVRNQRTRRPSSEKLVPEELKDFVDKDGKAKQWLRARCLESVVASSGLNEYLKTLLSYRGGSPSKIAPLNLMFASSQIARALDPIVVMLLEQLHMRKKLIVSRRKLDALIAILSPRLSFSVEKKEVYFDVDQVEQLRNLLLEIALEKFHPSSIQDTPRPARRSPRLRTLGKAPDVSLEKLIDISNDYPNLSISVEKGVLRWRYAKEPTIFVKNGFCFYDQLEVDSKKIGHASVSRQFNLMKKVISKENKTPIQ